MLRQAALRAEDLADYLLSMGLSEPVCRLDRGSCFNVAATITTM